MTIQREFVVYGGIRVVTAGAGPETSMIPLTFDKQTLHTQAAAILGGKYPNQEVAIYHPLRSTLATINSHQQAAEMLKKIAAGQVAPTAGQVENLQKILEQT